ncbi:glycosyltransferase family 4 protein [Sulfitobacter sp. HI0129]|uniref:glycosyltransferase family 4 protein n=1 Tax=Sulfitobacter sp. HI0129 TaxID=1822268 RepID=UPI001373766B|nr:glycosyltransferase [Sulfitobacter sp. HI0129]
MKKAGTPVPAATSRIVVTQPALPLYRIPLFARLSKIYGERFTVYASRQSELGALNAKTTAASWFRPLNPARPILCKLEWQSGALAISLRRGDILVLSGQPRTISNLALILKAKLVGARVVWWGHFWSATSRPWRATIRFWIMRLADAILFYTDQEVDEYQTQNARHSSVPVKGLNNGIETDQIVALRAPYEASRRPRDLLFIGRVTKKAELSLLLDALSHESCISVTLDVIGDGDEAEVLRNRAAQLGISDRIAWHGALTDEPQIARIANKCRLFVYPGSVGLSLIHGLTYGLPAIVHDDRWQHMPEIAAHRPGENGSAFRFGNADALANTISDLIKQPDQLVRSSTEAVKTTAKTFNVEDMARRFCALVDGLE